MGISNIKKGKCKSHWWRVGSSNARVNNKKIDKDTLNLWCEKCGKKMLAHYRPKIKLGRRS